MQDIVGKVGAALSVLSNRSVGWILSGRMTPEEARYLDAHPDLTDAQVAGCMDRVHGEQHRRILALAPDLNRPAADLWTFLGELSSMHQTVQRRFLEGTITIPVARFGSERYQGEALERFLDRNARRTFEDLERQRTLNIMAKNPRIPSSTIAYYRDVPVKPLHLQLYASSLGTPLAEFV